MEKNEKINLKYYLFEANALKCWRCQSSGKNGEFCKDPFDANSVTPAQKR